MLVTQMDGRVDGWGAGIIEMNVHLQVSISVCVCILSVPCLYTFLTKESGSENLHAAKRSSSCINVHQSPWEGDVLSRLRTCAWEATGPGSAT